MSKLAFNQFTPFFNFGNIRQNFVIIQFSVDEGWLSYAAVNEMDVLLTHPTCKAVSICFTGGKEAYILYKKSEFQNTQLAGALQDIKQLENVRTEKVDAGNIKEYKLFQLFLNACQNSEKPRFRYNNLNGGLLVSVPEKSFYNKADQSRMMLEIKVSRGNTLELNTVTFTSMDRYQDLIKNKFGNPCDKRKKKVLQKPRYFFDAKLNTFRRNFDDNRSWKDLYIRMRPAKQQLIRGKKIKNMIPFFNTNPKKYVSSKVGILASLLLDDFTKQYSKYITLKQRIIENEETKEFKPRKVFFENIENRSISLIDNIKEKELTEAILNTYQEQFGVTVHLREKIDENGINLLFNEDKEFYKLGDDPYKKSTMDIAIQNFTRQQYMANAPKESKSRKKPQGADQLFKVMLEAQLKYDIRCGQLSIFNWLELNIKKDWVFAITVDKNKDEKTKEVELIYYFLKITPTGKLIFSYARFGESRCAIEKRIIQIFSRNSNKNGKPIIEGVICDGKNNFNTISDTRLITLPELKSMHNYVMKGVIITDETISKTKLLLFIKDFIEVHGADSKIAEALTFVEQKDGTLVKAIDLKEMFKKIRINPLIEKFVSEFRREYGLWLKHLAKNKKTVDKTFGSMVGLHAIKSSKEVLFWANKQMGETKGNFTKTTKVRRLQIDGNSIPVYDHLLEMMAVDFVRINAPSVVPFPFKLLREYQKIILIPDTDEIKSDEFNMNI